MVVAEVNAFPEDVLSARDRVINQVCNLLVTVGGEDGNTASAIAVFKNGKVFKVWLLRGGGVSLTFRDIPSPAALSYYRVELWGIPEVAPLFLPLYGTEIALTNPIYINF